MPTINHAPTPWLVKPGTVKFHIFNAKQAIAQTSGDSIFDEANAAFLARAANAHDEFVKLLEDARERLTYQCDAGTKQLLADRIVAALKASGDWVK